MEEMTSEKGVSTGMVIGIMLIVAIVFGAGMYLYANNKAAKENENLNAQITELQNKISDAKTATTPTDETVGWETYKDTKYGFEIKYPKDVFSLANSSDYASGVVLNSHDMSSIEASDTPSMQIMVEGIKNSAYNDAKNEVDYAPAYAEVPEITGPETKQIGEKEVYITTTNRYDEGDNYGFSRSYYFPGFVLIFSYAHKESEGKFVDYEQKILSSIQFIKSDSAQPITAQDSSDLILSGIKLAIPSSWKIKDMSDKSIAAEIPGIKSPVTLSMEKCDESGPVGCFGTARFNFRKTSWGGIYDLASNADDPRYGLQFDNLDNTYTADADFGDYQPSDKDVKMIDKVMESASLAGK